MKTVFVPLDGSERAEAALGAAVPLATRLGAELVLLSARWPNVAIETTRDYLDVQAASLDRPARTLLVLDRDPADAIALAANEHDAIVCMATRGRGAMRQAVLGSVAEEVVRRSATPLMMVGPRFESTWKLGDTPMVLAGLHGSDRSPAAALAAGCLAREIRARVRVVEVLRPSDIVALGEVPTSPVELLEEVVGQLEAGGVAAEYAVIDGFDPADALVRDAGERHAAFIALASHGRSGLARTALGSVSMRTVRQASCPVLVAGPKSWERLDGLDALRGGGRSESLSDSVPAGGCDRRPYSSLRAWRIVTGECRFRVRKVRGCHVDVEHYQGRHGWVRRAYGCASGDGGRCCPGAGAGAGWAPHRWSGCDVW